MLKGKELNFIGGQLLTTWAGLENRTASSASKAETSTPPGHVGATRKSTCLTNIYTARLGSFDISTQTTLSFSHVFSGLENQTLRCTYLDNWIVNCDVH